MQFQLPGSNYDNSDAFFSFFLNFLFVSFSFYKELCFRNKNSKTTKARNLKFGDMISLYMKLFAPALLEALLHVVWGRRAKNL